jgi:hypothetical protein
MKLMLVLVLLFSEVSAQSISRQSSHRKINDKSHHWENYAIKMKGGSRPQEMQEASGTKKKGTEVPRKR